MLYVHSECRKIPVVQLPGFRGLRSQFKAWRKRDDLEGKIGRLKEHMSKCYSQFTVGNFFYMVLMLMSVSGILCCSNRAKYFPNRTNINHQQRRKSGQSATSRGIDGSSTA